MPTTPDPFVKKLQTLYPHFDELFHLLENNPSEYPQISEDRLIEFLNIFDICRDFKMELEKQHDFICRTHFI